MTHFFRRRTFPPPSASSSHGRPPATSLPPLSPSHGTIDREAPGRGRLRLPPYGPPEQPGPTHESAPDVRRVHGRRVSGHRRHVTFLPLVCGAGALGSDDAPPIVPAEAVEEDVLVGPVEELPVRTGRDRRGSEGNASEKTPAPRHPSPRTCVTVAATTRDHLSSRAAASPPPHAVDPVPAPGVAGADEDGVPAVNPVPPRSPRPARRRASGARCCTRPGRLVAGDCAVGPATDRVGRPSAPVVQAGVGAAGGSVTGASAAAVLPVPGAPGRRGACSDRRPRIRTARQVPSSRPLAGSGVPPRAVRYRCYKM